MPVCISALPFKALVLFLSLGECVPKEPRQCAPGGDQLLESQINTFAHREQTSDDAHSAPLTTDSHLCQDCHLLNFASPAHYFLPRRQGCFECVVDVVL